MSKNSSQASLRAGDSDGESAVDSDNESSTTSVIPSILTSRQIHGRTYQNFSTNTEYWAPNDEKQREAWDMTHGVLLMAMDGKLFQAPISPGTICKRILDIGTGTGLWAVDVAQAYPNTEVIGIDITPMQPIFVPNNLSFQLDDAQLPWTFPNNHFDFIHTRGLVGAIKDWPSLYSEIYRCLKPGGWIEHVDFSLEAKADDDSLPKESPLRAWADVLTRAGDKMGRTFRVIDESRNMPLVRSAGFLRVRERRLKLPLGEWHGDAKWKTIGKITQAMLDDSIDGCGMYVLTCMLGWKLEEAQAYVAQTKKVLKDDSVHAYFEASIVFAQKPLNALS